MVVRLVTRCGCYKDIDIGTRLSSIRVPLEQPAPFTQPWLDGPGKSDFIETREFAYSHTRSAPHVPDLLIYKEKK